MQFSHKDEKKEDLSAQSLSLDREVITIGIGTCGNRMSTGFWRNVLDEHNLDQMGILTTDDDYIADNTRIRTYFREMKDTPNRFVPRNLICDLDVTTIDSVRASCLGSLFSADSYVWGGNSAHNVYSLGYNSCIIDDIIEEIRSEAEKCSSIQGFQLLHAVGGGTGSGLTSYLSQLIRDDYYDRIIQSYTVYPSSLASDIVIEPYNMMLSLPSVLSYHDINSAIDNETLFDFSSRLFHKPRPNFLELNEYICNIISASTAGIRFKGSLNMDLRKLAMNLVPFPRLKFMSISDAPLMCNKEIKYTKISIDTLLTILFHSHEFLLGLPSSNYDYGKYLAASIIFRGGKTIANEWEIANGLRKTMDELFYEGLCLHNINILHSTMVHQIPYNYPLTATLYANNTAIKDLFERNLRRFNKFYKKKAHLQYYLNNGTLEEDFEEAINECKDLLQEYNDKDESNIDATNNIPSIDTKNRKKLKKNDVFWNQFKKGKKKTNKRVVIMSDKRKKKLKLREKMRNKKKIVANKRKKRSKRKIESSDESDDEEESSSSSSSSSSSTDTSSSSTPSSNNNTSSYGLGSSDDSSDTSSSSNKSSSNTTPSDDNDSSD